MISCSIDNVMSMFDFRNRDQGNAKLQEEDLIDGAYSSTQPMIDCGFITEEIIYAVTSINTVEFIRMADAMCFMTLTQVSKKALSNSIYLIVPPRCDFLNQR